MKKAIKTIFYFIKKLVYCFLNIVIFLIGLLIPKSKRIVVFGSWFGQRYADNSKALFEMLNEDPRIKKCIWITKNKSVLKQVREKGYEAYYYSSPKSIWYHLRAKTHIVDQESKDINRFFSIRCRRINLYHGIIGLKKVGIDSALVEPSKRQQRLQKMAIFSPGFWRNCYYLSTSKFGGEKLEHSFLLKKNHIVYASYPRHHEYQEEVKYPESYSKYLNFQKILYLPTFRNNDSGLDLRSFFEKINEFCKNNNCVFFYKPHFVEKYAFDNNDFSHIVIIEKEVNINELLPFFDLLITDYSSVCWDFLSIRKPVFFFPYDYESYIKNERGFYCDYLNDLPKDFIFMNQEELLKGLTDYSCHNKDFFMKHEKEYMESASRFNEFIDNFTIEPIVECILGKKKK